MSWDELRRFLRPTGEEDPGFHKEMLRLSRQGLFVAGALTLGGTLFLYGFMLLTLSHGALIMLRSVEAVTLLALGLAQMSLARGPLPRLLHLGNKARLLALVFGLVCALIIIVSSSAATHLQPAASNLLPAELAIVVLGAVAAIPLRPAQTLWFAILVTGAYPLAAYYLGARDSMIRDQILLNTLFIFTVAMLGTALTAILYRQRYESYRAHAEALRASNEVRQAEARVLLAESAASMERLAAALSHELNNPLGALLSGVDTLLLLASKQATSPPEAQPRLVKLQGELRKSVKESATRLRLLVTRMQRFTNLDKAEMQNSDVNQILNDVAALLTSELKINRAELILDLNLVPGLICRPPQISAMFSNLLSNALDSLNGNGRVRIGTANRDGSIEICFEDNGVGMDPLDLENIFEPSFKVSEGRVKTGNWSLFSARQVVREHGGQISIESEKGKGTLVRVVLPGEDQPGSLKLN